MYSDELLFHEKFSWEKKKSDKDIFSFFSKFVICCIYQKKCFLTQNKKLNWITTVWKNECFILTCKNFVKIAYKVIIQ